MTAKFTKGPWKLSGRSGIYDLPDVCREGGDCILMADSCGGTIGAEEMRANLTLAAASPTMLEALKSAADYAEECFRKDDYFPCDLAQRLQEAIRLAEEGR